jgi:hypothetical protein
MVATYWVLILPVNIPEEFLRFSGWKMEKKRNFSGVGIELYKTDFEKLGRVGNKVLNLLSRKIKNPADAYLLLKLLCFFFEDSIGFSLEPKEESKLRKMLVDETEDFEV